MAGISHRKFTPLLSCKICANNHYCQKRNILSKFAYKDNESQTLRQVQKKVL